MSSCVQMLAALEPRPENLERVGQTAENRRAPDRLLTREPGYASPFSTLQREATGKEQGYQQDGVFKESKPKKHQT